MQDHDDVADLAPLAKLSATLQSLNLSLCNQVADLGPLAACTMLQHLDMEMCDQVSDVGPLGACTML